MGFPHGVIEVSQIEPTASIICFDAEVGRNGMVEDVGIKSGNFVAWVLAPPL